MIFYRLSLSLFISFARTQVVDGLYAEWVTKTDKLFGWQYLSEMVEKEMSASRSVVSDCNPERVESASSESCINTYEV